MNVNQLKYLTISDIHFGHDKNETSNIKKNFINYFMKNDKLFKKLDIIFVLGDIFDKLLNTNSEQYKLTLEAMTWLIIYCKKNNIKLRILEGTPSHDWKQIKALYNVIKDLKIDIDFKYIDVLYIENMNDLGINILYIPDEWNHDASKTFKEVKELLLKHNLQQVDITMIHGQFHYQLPMVKLESSHNEEDYLNITKYYISIGHIHIFSVFGRIIAQGSFDRLAHGEESPKGAVVITLDKIHGNSYLFIENKDARIFKTFRYNVKDIDELINKLKKDIYKYRDQSYIRVIVPNDSKLKVYEKKVNNYFTNYYIKIEYVDKNNKVVKINMLEDRNIDSFSITERNIVELMNTEMKKHKLTTKEWNIYQEEFLEIINI